MALAADWLQVCHRINQVVARQRLLIEERLAALDHRRAALRAVRDIY
jgi:hypothetical protein